MLYKRFSKNPLVRILGVWQEIEYGGQSIPVAGIAYYISPPRDFRDIVGDPIHSLAYIIFVLSCCGLFAKYWIQISGESPKDVAKKLKDEDMALKGHRDTSMVKMLEKYIPIAAACNKLFKKF